MQSHWVHHGPKVFRWFLPLGLILLAAGLFFSTRTLEAHNTSIFPLLPTPRFSASLSGKNVLPNEASRWIDQAQVPVEAKLLRGETVADVFGKLGLQGSELREATNVLAQKVDLRSLKAGNHYSAFFNNGSRLASFEMTLDGSGRIELVHRGAQWQSDWRPFHRAVEMRSVRGTLAGSLEESIRTAGGPPALAYRLADVFQWDLDFTKDLQKGDTFEVLYEEVQMDGRFHDIGTIYGATYDNRGRLHEAYRYGDSGVFYDGEGRPMKKMFLRSPLRYSPRITSVFSLHRFHPVLKEYRPHYGVDYGAPVGTPVQVTANGVVSFAGWDRGGGNVVKVMHPGGYLTCYLHLSRFASGIRTGARVRQGDTIAFTGATGLASGPHLDYRVKHGDGWIDPLSLKGVRDEPIPATRLAAFRSWREQLRGGMRDVKLAKALHVPGVQKEGTQLAVGDAAPQFSRSGVAR